MDYHALGKRIREERLRLNLTQEKLAEEVGVSTAYIGQIERRREKSDPGQACKSCKPSGCDHRLPAC